MYLKISKFFVLPFIFVFLISLSPAYIFASEESFESKIIITEIKLGGNGEPKEFVSLYNQSQAEISLSDYRLEYIKDDFVASCYDPDWGGSPSTVRALEGVLGSGVVSTFKYNLTNDSTLTDSRSGSIRLVEQNSDQLIIHDIVGWGQDSICFENFSAPMPSPGESLHRYIDCETSLPVDTNNNLADFGLSGVPSPGELAGTLINCPASDPDNEGDGGMGGGSGDETQNSCDGVLITEVLPNPAGLDGENEFIELYNPTSKNISLEGCQLTTTANSKFYAFGDTELTAKQYKAFYNDITGLTLSNLSGGNVYLLDTDGSEIQDVTYQPDLDDDVVWALNISQNTWTISYVQTPGKPNKIIEIKPCLKGQFRNMETNRCNNILVEAGLGPCPAGKFRNPETNRCKSLLDASSQLKPCKPGQFRNPETNRCKSLSTSSRSLVPCKPDQERNPETNRCRKVAELSSGSENNGVKDVLSVSDVQDKTSWAMAGFSLAGASAYAVWEWRREMLEKLLALKSKLGIK